MRLYWYAPFNNAYEHVLASKVVRGEDTLLVHTQRDRRTREPPMEDRGLTFCRDLPEQPSGGGVRGAVEIHAQRISVAMGRAACRRRAVRMGHFDVVHIHTVDLITDAVALPLLRRSTSRFVLSVHNVRPHVARLPRRAETRILRQVYGAATRLLVAHPVLRRQLEEEFGIPPRRVSLVPLPIPVCDDADDRIEEPDTLRVLFFGTLRRTKGISVLLDAFRSSALRSASVRLHFAGRGEQALEHIVMDAAAGSAGRITAEIGYITSARRSELFRSSDLIVLPYTSIAAQSGVLSDAYSYGLPVIVTDVGPVGHIVRDEKTGWVVAPGNCQALETAILDAFQDSSRRSDIRTTMLAVAKSRSPLEIAKKIRSIYDET